MGERFLISKRQTNSSSQLRTQCHYSQMDYSEQLKKNKTDSQLSNSLKKISKSIKNIHSSKQDPNAELGYFTSIKPSAKYNSSKFPNLEKKTDVQRVRWFSRQNKVLEQHQMFLKFLESNNSLSNKIIIEPQTTTQNKINEQNQLNFCDKYFVVKTPIKPIRIRSKQSSNQQITFDSTVFSCKKKSKINTMTLEGFFLKNNELKRHCQTQQDTNSVLDQMGINKIQHINLYSSIVKGVKNDILHHQYKNALKDIFEQDDQSNLQDQEIAKELQKKSIFQNPFSQHATPNSNNKQIIDLRNQNKIDIFPNQPIEQQSDIQRRKNKIKRVLLQINVFLHWMMEQKLSYKDILSGNVFQEKPYQSKNSKICFQKVKSNDYDLVTQFIQDNKYLVYDYDHYKLTLLHHAVIRDHAEIAAYLLEQKSEVNCKDIQGRTPLYYAIKGRCNICVQILLYFRASPWGNQKNNYDKYLEFLDPKVRDLYKKAKTVNLILLTIDTSENVNFTCFKKNSLLVIIKINFYIQMIIAFLILFTSSFAHEWSQNTLVKMMNEELYDNSESDSLFIMFYAPWCPHCIRLIPTWESFAENFQVAAVNCEDESKLCSRFQIKGFPSLIYIPSKSSKLGYKFQGKREVEEFTNFVQNGWQKDDVLKIHILDDYTIIDQLKEYLSDPLFISVIILSIIFVIIIFKMSKSDISEEKTNLERIQSPHRIKKRD